VKRAFFRFYAELNDFLPPEKRTTAFQCPFDGRQSVKHLIESLGVPHTEVDLVLVNGQSVDFSHILVDCDRVSVYPVFEAFDIAPLTRVRPQPLRVTRFVADAHLGRLAAYLRMLGFDTLYRQQFKDDEVAMLAARERRIILTRDRDLLKRRSVTHGHFVREISPRLQLAEIVERFDLAGASRPFTRCMKCNRVLERAGRLSRCGDCGNLYWEGSHYSRMEKLIEEVMRKAGSGFHDKLR
jgi:uncharacterized protein with PIN domain